MELNIAINSVLIIKENILFLEEWLDYHVMLGFNKIYLYDNSKVEKMPEYERSINNQYYIAQKINKYGIKYDEIVNLNKN